jgi:hypothetical protein
VQSTSSVDQDHIDFLFDAGSDRFESHAGWIGPSAPERSALLPAAPGLQLVSRGRTERISGTKQYVLVLGHQDSG